MKPINPRSGHFTLGPDPKSPWYIRVIGGILISLFIGTVTMMEKIGDAIGFVLELFK